MKRTLLIGLSVVVAAAIFSQTWQAETQAYADKGPLPPQSEGGSNQLNAYEPSPQKRTRTNTVYVLQFRPVEIVTEIDPRLQEYSDLIQQRAQRMSPEEFEEAFTEVKAELEAQNEAAEAELRRAIEILEQLIEESAGTPAGSRARYAIPILQGRIPMSEPTGQSPYWGGVPTPVESLPTY